MAYDNKQMLCMVWPEFDFGGGAAEVLSFRMPTGYTGKILKIGVSITETFANDSTEANFQVGTAADNDAYAKLNIADGAADEDFYDETDDTNAILAADIPADTLIEINLTNGTDGSAVAGKGYPTLWLQIYKPGA